MDDSQDWVPLTDWQGFYEVHPQGKVRSTGRLGKELKIASVKGRPFVTLSYRDSTGKTVYTKQALSQIMASHFLRQPSYGEKLCYYDNNPLNCSVDNLYWQQRRSLPAHAIKLAQAKAKAPPPPTQQEMEKLCQMLDEDPPPAPAPAPAPKFPLIILANGKPKYDPETGEDLTWWYQENGELPPTPVDGKTLNRRR